jgi:hypothetical protein
MPLNVLVAIIDCPECAVLLEGTWAEPAESDDSVDAARQLCGACGHTWEAEYPGYSFKTEAG